MHEWSLADRYMPVQNLDVLTILGFVILAGVVVNNAILIVHQTNNFLTGRSEMDEGTPTGGESGSTAAIDQCTNGTCSPRQAIRAAVESRVRPILMSTLTSVGGMLPLVLIPGSGSELYRGLGAVVVGGLLVSTLFTLVLVPVLLSALLSFRSQQPRGKDEVPTGRIRERDALSNGQLGSRGVTIVMPRRGIGPVTERAFPGIGPMPRWGMAMASVLDRGTAGLGVAEALHAGLVDLRLCGRSGRGRSAPGRRR